MQRGMARVQRIDRARKADAAEIVEDARADRFRPFGDANDGDRSRIDQLVEGEAHTVHVKRRLAPGMNERSIERARSGPPRGTWAAALVVRRAVHCGTMPIFGASAR